MQLVEGWGLLNEGDRTGARRIAARLIEADHPRLTPLGYQLSGAASLEAGEMSAGDAASAADMLGKAFRAGVADAAYPLALALAQQQRFAEAVQPLVMAARQDNYAVPALVLLARVQLMLEDLPQALKATSAALQTAARSRQGGTGGGADGEEWFKLALGLYERNQMQASAACFDECARTGHPRLAKTAAENARALRGQAPEQRSRRFGRSKPSSRQSPAGS